MPLLDVEPGLKAQRAKRGHNRGSGIQTRFLLLCGNEPTGTTGFLAWAEATVMGRLVVFRTGLPPDQHMKTPSNVFRPDLCRSRQAPSSVHA